MPGGLPTGHASYFMSAYRLFHLEGNAHVAYGVGCLVDSSADWSLANMALQQWMGIWSQRDSGHGSDRSRCVVVDGTTLGRFTAPEPPPPFLRS